jgi:2-isopropylmalate synthase
MLKARDTYQHIDPERVGNEMRAVVSELSGRGNLLYQARSHGVDIDRDQAQQVLHQVKHLEHEGFSFEAADASIDLMLHRARADYAAPFEVIDFMVVTELRHGRGLLSEATVKVRIDGETTLTAAEGNGPVNALAQALHKTLCQVYPGLTDLHLSDYKVRILDGSSGTAATTRVLVTLQQGERTWTTVGASPNIIEASWRALSDGMEYALLAR